MRGFWSSEKLKARALIEKIVDDYSSDNVSHGAYELALGAEAFLTSTPEGTKTTIELGKSIVIPPGQFAILLTEERVYIPADAIGFISIRFSVKRRGLINVSGFHVDPGYSFRLKFAVYNAGSRSITLERGQRYFMLWLCDLDQKTADLYEGLLEENDTITAKDQDDLRGVVSSPAELKSQFDTLKNEDFATLKNKDFIELGQKFESQKGIYGIYVALLIAIFVRLLFVPWTFFWSSTMAEEKIELLEKEFRFLERRIDSDALESEPIDLEPESVKPSLSVNRNAGSESAPSTPEVPGAFGPTKAQADSAESSDLNGARAANSKLRASASSSQGPQSSASNQSSQPTAPNQASQPSKTEQGTN